MAAPLSADRLVQALRDEGLVVHEYRNWRSHNRNHKGAWGPINGVMIHHTVTRGTESSVRLCYDGYSTLPGPLCHGVIDKAGEVWLVGNGRANHAGLGDGNVLADVIAERELSPDNEANTDGNARFYGFECINMGDGEDPWPEAQLEAIEKAAAAICRAYGWNERSVIGHLEWQPGKVDPRGFGMDWMRDRIADRLSAPPAQQHDQEDYMPAYSGLAATKPMGLRRGDWELMRWDAEYQDGASDHAPGGRGFADGPCFFTGTATLRFDGLPDGAQVQARVVELEDGKVVHRHEPGEALASPGDTFLRLPFTENFRWARQAAIEVVYHAPEAPADPVTVTGSLHAGIWK